VNSPDVEVILLFQDPDDVPYFLAFINIQLLDARPLSFPFPWGDSLV
jgi:hypothetical protein